MILHRALQEAVAAGLLRWTLWKNITFTLLAKLRNLFPFSALFRQNLFAML
jgi:hypothetical protein